MASLNVQSRFQFAILSVAMFQALAVAGFVADTRAQAKPVEEGRTIASSVSDSKLPKGTRVLITTALGVSKVTLLSLGFENRGQIIGQVEDGRYLVRHLERVEGRLIGSTRVLDRDDFVLGVSSIDGLRVGDKVELAAGRTGRISAFYQRGLIEVDHTEFVRRHEVRVPASRVSE